MKKRFDAVKFQRKIREELGRKYLANRKVFLSEIKEKYGYLAEKNKAEFYKKVA